MDVCDTACAKAGGYGLYPITSNTAPNGTRVINAVTLMSVPFMGGLPEAGVTATGGRALVPAVDAVYLTATERVVAGYNVWGTAGRVGSTYNVNVLGLYATEGSKGLGALPGRKLLDIFKALPEKTSVTLSTEGDRVTLKAGRSAFKLSSLPAAEFPLVDELAR